MDFLTMAKERKTTYEFSDKKVPESAIKNILEAARWAPSCSNSQPWHFIVIKEQKRIQELMATANFGDFHSNPTLIIAVILLENQCPGPGFSCFRGKDSGTHDCFMSAAMATLNITYAAQEKGIGSCILTAEQKAAAKILNTSQKDSVALMVGLGYPATGAYQKPRERKALDKIVSYEKM